MHGRASRLAAVAVAALLVAPACGSDGGGTSAAGTTTTVAAPAPTVAAATGPRPLPPAPALPPAPDAGPEPTALSIDRLDVVAAPVRPVGVEDDGQMEIPGVHEVGWYRFGSRPGREGSSVLAAHIAYDGVDGVFRHLDDLGAGDAVQVTLADGSTVDYVATAVAQVPKAELSPEVWARQGPGRLYLITCGGEFDEATGHYEDNVVVAAEPA